jgi:hypothetical protein
MKAKKVSKPTLECDTYLIAQAVNHNAEVLEDALSRIKKLEKRMAKEETDGKPHEIEEFSKSEDMTREEAIDMVIKVFDTLEGECNIEYDWSKEHNARDMAIKALEQESFKNAYIQVAKERDIAIGQLNELGYSLGEKIRPCDKESENKECRGCHYNDGKPHAECVVCDKAAGKDAKEKVIAEIDRQGEWLAEAGYNAYNVDIAFGSIIRALRKWGEG